jgi:hypothetical protein
LPIIVAANRSKKVLDDKKKYELRLIGIDGSNPLAFLAALGAFRLFGTGNNDATLKWVRLENWQPIITTDTPVDETIFLNRLETHLKCLAGHEAFQIGTDLKVEQSKFRDECREALENCSKQSRARTDFLSAFGSDSLTDDKGKIQITPLCLLAGQQKFLTIIQEIIDNTESDHLRKTLFDNWKYDDPRTKTSLRWDPADEVRHALQWKEPSVDPDRDKRGSMLGANRLAIEALPFFVTIPNGKQLQTTGFGLLGRRKTLSWTWPIWEIPLSIWPIRSLLAFKELQEKSPDRKLLRKMGVAEVFRCQRIKNGNYRNFSPAQPA